MTRVVDGRALTRWRRRWKRGCICAFTRKGRAIRQISLYGHFLMVRLLLPFALRSLLFLRWFLIPGAYCREDPSFGRGQIRYTSISCPLYLLKGFSHQIAAG